MPRVLIVEDEPLLRELVIDELTDAGFNVASAASGDDALAVLESDSQFDLLFTDVRMPGDVDGWELGRRAVKLNQAIRVIYATGYAEQAPVLAAHERFVGKPFRTSDILGLIAQLGISD